MFYITVKTKRKLLKLRAYSSNSLLAWAAARSTLVINSIASQQRLWSSHREPDMHSPAATCVRLKEALLVLLRVGDPELHDETLQIRSMSDGGQSAYAVTLRLPTTLSIAAGLSRITGRLILAEFSAV